MITIDLGSKKQRGSKFARREPELPTIQKHTFISIYKTGPKGFVGFRLSAKPKEVDAAKLGMEF